MVKLALILVEIVWRVEEKREGKRWMTIGGDHFIFTFHSLFRIQITERHCARAHMLELNKNNDSLTGLTAFPSNERLSPLDTFFDLLTAKGMNSLFKFHVFI